MNTLHVLIGTHNPAKQRYYQFLLNEISVEVELLNNRFDEKFIVEEDLFDVYGNSIKKAIQYAKHFGSITLSDDTAIYIESLNNEPGVATRRWGGQLSEDVSDEEWLSFLKEKIQNIPPPIRSRKLQVITLADKYGNYKSVEQELCGEIRLRDNYVFVSGNPFSGIFFLDQFQKYESDMNREETELLQNNLRRQIKEYLLDKKYFKM